MANRAALIERILISLPVIWLGLYVIGLSAPSVLAATVATQAAEAPDCAAPALIQLPAVGQAATLSNVLTRGRYACYTFDAEAGRTLRANVRSARSNVVLLVYQPGFSITTDDAGPDVSGPTIPGAGEADEAVKLSAKLARAGRYLILVGMTRGAAEPFTLSIALQ